jgi:hypothetical protein
MRIGVDKLEGRFVEGGFGGKYRGFKAIGCIAQLVYTDPDTGLLAI